ncbi:MAG: HlyD family efflux transporter periplasmic adaptor subunit [Isosphaeraceae bacterium]
MAERDSRLGFAGRFGGSIGVLLAGAGLWGGWRGLPARTGTQADAPAASAGTRGATVHALARLEPVGGLVVVGVRPGARVEKVLVGQGDVVKVGQPLGVTEGHEVARCQLALAEARKADAVCRRARERTRVALEREREDELQKAKNAMLDNIAKALKWQDERFDSQISTFPKEYLPELKRPLDELKSKRDQLHIEEQKAHFEREQSRIDQRLLGRKRAKEDEALADGGTDDQLLDRQIDLARATSVATTVKAPIAGTVLDIMAHSGEISSGPLLALGDLTAVAAVAEVDQADIGSVREGDAATAAILGQVVPGKVTRIGRLVGRNQLTNVDPRTPQDLRVVKVTVQLDREEPAARLMNLQVEVVITPRKAQQ